MPSTRAREVGTGNGPIGYLTWFSVPETNAGYDALKDLAAQVGLPETYTPSPPSPRDAWRKATQVGKRGLKVPQSAMNKGLIKRALDDDKGMPRAVIRTVEISRAAPVLIRHLVLFGIIPGASRKSEQLELGTVAVLEFNIETEVARSTLTADSRALEWVSEGFVRKSVRQMGDDMQAYTDQADNNKIRSSIRDLIEDLHRVCLKNTGGVYFVPKASQLKDAAGNVTSAFDALEAMQQWINGMDRWASSPADAPMFRKVTLAGENAMELRHDIVGSALDQFRADLQGIADDLEPVLAGRALGRTAEKILEKVRSEHAQIYQAASAYKESLDVNLNELRAMFMMAQKSLQEARDQLSSEWTPEDLDTDSILALLADD